MIVKLADVGSLGLNKDVPEHELSEQPLAWSDVRNMTFRAGLAERVQGYLEGFDTTPTKAAYGLFSAVKASGTAFVVAGATDAAYDYNGTTENAITGPTIAATADTKWSGGELTGFLVLNESTTDPQFIAVENLGGSTNLAALTNWPATTTCKVLRPFKYYLVAANMTEGGTVYPYKVRWSTAAVPGTLPANWVASTTNDAGSIDLSANYGPVVDMLALGDQLVIYRSRGLTVMRHIGGTDAANRLVMAFNDVPSGSVTGILALNCVCDIQSFGHLVLSQSDVYLFDGTTTRSILDKRMRDWLRNNVDSTNAKRCFVFNHAEQQEAWVCIVESGKTAATKAIIWNYADNTIGLRDIPNLTAAVHCPVSEGLGASTYDALDALNYTYDNVGAVYPTYSSFVSESKFRKTVLASTDNKLYVVGNAATENGTAMVGELTREYISLGDAQRVKLIRSVWPRLDAGAGQTFEIAIGTSMAVDDPTSWQDAQIYTVGTSRKVDVNRAGRFMSLRMRCSSGGAWRLRSLDVDAQPQGLY